MPCQNIKKIVTELFNGNILINLSSNLKYTSHQNKVSLVGYFVFLYNSLDHGNKNGELGSHLYHHGTQRIHGSGL
jgi:hypothetical protein